MKELKYIVSVNCSSEFADNIPTHAVIRINQELWRWIQKARVALNELKANGVALYDSTPDLKETTNFEDPLESDLEEWKGNIDNGLTLYVDDNWGIRWTGYIKHSDWLLSTETITYQEIEENLKVLRTKKSEVPLIIGNKLEYKTSNAILNKRLKED
jgi:hypothetical protein